MTRDEARKITVMTAEKLDDSHIKLNVNLLVVKQKYSRGPSKWMVILGDKIMASGESLEAAIEAFGYETNVRCKFKRKKRRKKKLAG